VGQLEYDILGDVRVWRDGDELDLGGAKQRAVLAVLLLEANQPVPAQRILTAVWGDEQPGGGANVVQKYVSALRRTLEPERSPRARSTVLALHQGGYRLVVEPGALDADAVATLVRRAEAAAEAGLTEQATGLLSDALDRWRGEPLAGLDGPVFEEARARLAEQRAAAAELYAGLLLSAGRPAQALPELTALVRRFPYRERAQALYLETLYRTGRQAEALTAYAELRQRLVRDIGVEPGAELRQVHERILLAEPDPLELLAHTQPPATRISPEVAADKEDRPAGRWRSAWVRLGMALVPLASVGLATWLVFAFQAGWFRSRRAAYAAALYAILLAGWLLLITDDSGGTAELRNTVGVLALVTTWLGGTAHVVLEQFGPARRRTVSSS
jgi:SARP family transcriptional regulator, regulator of embCAB operon